MGVGDEPDDVLFRGMDDGEVKLAKYVRAQLGYPVMSVELCNDNYAAIIEDSVLWFQAHMGQVTFREFYVTHAQREYSVPDDVADVVEVILSERSDSDQEIAWDITSYGSLREIPYALWNVQQGGGLMSGITLQRIYYEMLSRVMSTDPAWEWDRVARKIRLKVPPDFSGPALYGYNLNKVRWDVMSPDQKMLIRMYATGKARMMLGMIRGKYADYPAAGGRVSLNGDALIAQAIDDIQAAEEKMRNMAVPLPFLTG